MNKCLGILIGLKVSIYSDHIIIRTETRKDHLGLLKKQITAILYNRLGGSEEKCEVMRTSINFLGHHL
jgi:hypothetical protein